MLCCTKTLRVTATAQFPTHGWLDQGGTWAKSPLWGPILSTLFVFVFLWDDTSHQPSVRAGAAHGPQEPSTRPQAHTHVSDLRLGDQAVVTDGSIDAVMLNVLSMGLCGHDSQSRVSKLTESCAAPSVAQAFKHLLLNAPWRPRLVGWSNPAVAEGPQCPCWALGCSTQVAADWCVS